MLRAERQAKIIQLIRERGYIENFNARLRCQLLDGEIFYGLREAQILIEQWRKYYNTKRPHSALGFPS